METTPVHLTLVAPHKRAPHVFLRALAAMRRCVAGFGLALGARLRREPKSLLLCETSALGDRRLVAVVQFERQRFLIGCSPSSVTLLARLPDAGPAVEVATTVATTVMTTAATKDGASQ